MVSKETGLAMEQRAERGPTRGSARGPGGPPYEPGMGWRKGGHLWRGGFGRVVVGRPNLR